ncbi:hypothetical protein CANARDRAFT_29969 [[Candida] arabinofermentans NRRL YB-2248]|uniref:Transcription initiation factor IIF subunit beta n=1 Tax=[Candida] arabinofermentans NRRL YB-2248 TaxID=983967 RepID=A0A1E4SVJ9_9ASCO|nr:hypothetical protein CANARDRAFT_29969 [[Candida] arabinofermentans NRRL YB-2248]
MSSPVKRTTPPAAAASSSDPMELPSASTDNTTQSNVKEEPNEQLDTGVVYDEDDLPIPNGIEEVDEAELEQAGESLDLNLSGTNNQIWLVKLPPQLSEIWKDDEFLDGKQLGNIKIEKGAPPTKTKILLELNDQIEEHKKIDQEYQLRMIKPIVENEYIFSETELDHFKHRLMYRTEVTQMPDQPKLKSLNKDAQNHAAKWTRRTKIVERQRPESGMGTTRTRRQHGKFKKFIPFAKTIPKKTSIVGKIVHECQVIPTKLSSNNALKLLEQKRRLKQMVKKKTINYMRDVSAGIMQGRAGPNIHTGATITLSRELAAKRDAAKAEGRASRMERDELMKLLFSMFNDYEYWTMKGIKEKTNQPEAYLKECLETIATMERKGTYALKYRLKDEYKRSREVERKERRDLDGDMDDDLRNGDNDDDDDDEDDDEDLDMEDVAQV